MRLRTVFLFFLSFSLPLSAVSERVRRTPSLEGESSTFMGSLCARAEGEKAGFPGPWVPGIRPTPERQNDGSMDATKRDNRKTQTPACRVHARYRLVSGYNHQIRPPT